jgi:hypothetical protein
MYPRTPCSSMDYSSACPSRSDTSIPPSKPPPSRRTPDNRPTYLLSLPTRHATQAKPPRRRPPLHWTLTQHPDPFRTRTCKRVLRARGAVHTAPPCTGVEEWLQRARVGRVASYDITLPDLTRPSLRLSDAPPSHTHTLTLTVPPHRHTATVPPTHPAPHTQSLTRATQSLTRPIKLSHVRHVSLRLRLRPAPVPVQITRREMRSGLEWGGSGLDADSHCG